MANTPFTVRKYIHTHLHSVDYYVNQKLFTSPVCSVVSVFNFHNVTTPTNFPKVAMVMTITTLHVNNDGLLM